MRQVERVAWTWIALLATAGAAGCVSTTGPADSLPPAPDVPALVNATEVFQPAVQVGPAGDAEVSLFVGRDGVTILACSHGGFRQPSPFWASRDGGATFTRYHPEPNPVPSGDCDVAILDDGTWVMIYDTIASTTVATSRDHGSSWAINPVAALPVGGVDRPWVMADGNDILLTYANVMALEPALQFFARSTDHGRSFVEHRPINVADPPQRPQSIMGHIIGYDENRTLRVPLARGDLVNGGPLWFSLASSRDGGSTWDVTDVTGPVPTSFALPVVSRAETGRLFLALSRDAPEGLADVEVIVSDDDGATWSEPIVVAEGVRFPGVRAPWIDARSDGSATLAWLARAGGEDPGWRVWSARVDPSNATQPVRFVGPVTEPVDEDNLYEFIMVRHGPDDRAHILYLVTGAGCKDPDPVSSRSAQCVWLLSEKPASV